MYKFMIGTTFFLGWAFYEMSGGADFKPAVPAAEAAASASQAAPENASSRALASAAGDRGSLAARGESAAPEATLTTEAAFDLPLAMVTPASLTGEERGNTAPSGDMAAQTSLRPDPSAQPEGRVVQFDRHGAAIPFAVEAAAEAGAESADRDLRIVTGNRVNLRQGPGTGYRVVGTLLEGDRVEVMADADGWVRLRTPTGKTGYMADFLVTASN